MFSCTGLYPGLPAIAKLQQCSGGCPLPGLGKCYKGPISLSASQTASLSIQIYRPNPVYNILFRKQLQAMCTSRTLLTTKILYG